MRRALTPGIGQMTYPTLISDAHRKFGGCDDVGVLTTTKVGRGAGSGRAAVEQAVAMGDVHGGTACRDGELGEQVGHVHAGGLLADEQ